MKDAYYFSHDSNASQDERILNLRADLSWQGYGLYWAIIERLRDATDFKYKIESIKGLAVSLGTQKIVIEQIINQYELFEKDDDFFWSPSLIRRMVKVEDKREQARRAGRKSGAVRSNDRSTTVQRPFNDRSTTDENQLNETPTECEQGKERKGNEKKGNESLDTHTIAREEKISILKNFEKRGIDSLGAEAEYDRFLAFYDQRDWNTSDGYRVRDPVDLAKTWTFKQNIQSKSTITNEKSNSRVRDFEGDYRRSISNADRIIDQLTGD